MMMLKARLPVAARRPVRCRTAPEHSATSTVVLPKPDEPAKIDNTISALDSLLGEQAQPKATSSISSPASAATSSPLGTSSNPVGGSFLWPTPQAGSSSKPGKPVSLQQVMGIEGWAPELINARCAMLGFLAALYCEFHDGQNVFRQMTGGGIVELLAVVALVTLASFAPMGRMVPLDEVFNANPKRVKTLGPFTPSAELINGRAAMFALGIILLTEGLTGASFFL